jgi:gamma-glutamyltranspeptidase/glutathione hydrolase
MWRQSGSRFVVLAGLALAACTGGGPQQGDIGYIEGFFGGLIADEPHAALVGREVLSAGGTAADAAVAAYFTMAVTMPGSASLGGGGVCLVHDAVRIQTEVISFLPGRAADGNASFAVPGNVRGMFLLHARYGELNWADLLVPAEEFARDGHAVSRAFARDYAESHNRVEADPGARAIFGGGVVAEGRLLRQIDLAAVISNIRTLGPGAFYDGTLGRNFASAVRAAGGGVTIKDLRNYKPELQTPVRFELGDRFLFFPHNSGGTVSAQVWAAAQADERFSGSDGTGPVRDHLLLEYGARAYRNALSGRSAAELVAEGAIGSLIGEVSDTAHRPVVGGAMFATGRAHDGASIVAVDNQGRTVACSFTMNGPFGAGAVAPGTGILLAVPGSIRASFPSVALVANENVGLTYFAAAGTGPSPVAVAAVALRTLRDDAEDMVGAVAAPRAFNTGEPDKSHVEAAMPEASRAALRELGHALEVDAEIARINGFYCPRGLPRVQTCQFVKDPRSHGLAVSADE